MTRSPPIRPHLPVSPLPTGGTRRSSVTPRRPHPAPTDSAQRSNAPAHTPPTSLFRSPRPSLSAAALPTPHNRPNSVPRQRVAAAAVPSPAPEAIDIETRIENLIRNMSLEQKLGQLSQYTVEVATGPGAALTTELRDQIRRGRVGSLFNIKDPALINELQHIAVEQSPHGVPLLIGNDTIHGYRTIFPVPLGMAASFDPSAVTTAARIAGEESRQAGIQWVFAPMVDVSRDARWGRVVEGAGEDVYVNEVMAAAAVRGFGENVLSTAKHLAAYGSPEAGRDYNAVDMSERTLRSTYLPPFRAALKAGAQTVMAAFHTFNGVPCHANAFLLREVLRDEWRFAGLVVSDYNGVGELIDHGVAGNPEQAGITALNAGVDMDMEGGIYTGALLDAARQGKVSPARIDEAVRRVLRLKFDAGVFDTPYVSAQDVTRLQQRPTAADRSTARDVAAKSVVLLENRDNTLPLATTAKKLAVVGPLADSKADMLGPWCAEGDPKDVTSVLDGLRHRAQQTGQKVAHAPGCSVAGAKDDAARIAEAVEAARNSDVVVAVVGESAAMSGEGASRADIGLPGEQVALLQALKATGKPLVVVLCNGRPLSLPWVAKNADAVLETWFLGIEAGDAIADVLYGDVNPGGKLPVTFPRTVGQVPMHYDRTPTARPAVSTDEEYTSRYIDVDVTPQYRFGYGLSYTHFGFSNLSVTPPADEGADSTNGAHGVNDKITIAVDIANEGQREGDEVVQVYIRDRVAAVAMPVAQLKAFERVTIEPGQRRTVQFQIDPQRLGYYDGQGQWRIDPGWFDVRVANSSDPSQGLTASFELTPTQCEAARQARQHQGS